MKTLIFLTILLIPTSIASSDWYRVKRRVKEYHVQFIVGSPLLENSRMYCKGHWERIEIE